MDKYSQELSAETVEKSQTKFSIKTLAKFVEKFNFGLKFHEYSRVGIPSGINERYSERHPGEIQLEILR